MTFDDQFVPSLRTDLLRRDIDGEAVLWSPIRADPVALDPVATVMLDVIDGVATISDLVLDVQDVIGVSNDIARAQVQRIIRRLDDARVLTASMPSPVPERQRELFINPPST